MGASHGHVGGNECSWYFVVFCMDTILGVSLAYLFLRAAECAARYFGVCPALENSGDYGQQGSNSISYTIWAQQMVLWCVVTVVARVFVELLSYSVDQCL